MTVCSKEAKKYTKWQSIFILLFGLLVFFFISVGCENPTSVDSAAVNDVAAVDNDEGVSGVTDEIDVTVANGNIYITVNEDGAIEIDASNVQLVEQLADGWSLIDGIAVYLSDNNGNLISGTVSVDGVTGQITFAPDDELDAGELYTLNVNVQGANYTSTVMIAVDVMEDGSEESQFAGVELCDKGTYALSELLVNGKSIFGWEFGENPFAIKIKVQNIEPGAKVLLTAYGVYNMEGHRNEVYFQRWSGSGNPVEDYQWKDANQKTYTGTISVNEEDSTLDGPDGDPDYSFWSTYFEIKIILDNIDITASSAAEIVVW